MIDGENGPCMEMAAHRSNPGGGGIPSLPAGFPFGGRGSCWH